MKFTVDKSAWSKTFVILFFLQIACQESRGATDDTTRGSDSITYFVTDQVIFGMSKKVALYYLKNTLSTSIPQQKIGA